MNANQSAYMILFEIGSTVLKGICYGENLEKAMESDSKTINLSYFRGMATSEGRLSYYDLFLFTNEENYCISKNRVIGVSKLSSSHALAFMDFLKRTTDFAKAKELPYFENHQLFEVKN